MDTTKEFTRAEQGGDAMAQADEVATLMTGRAGTYRLLSRLFRCEVDQELLDRMHAMCYPVHTGNDDVDQAHLLFATYLSNLWADSLTELSIDFSRTFLGNGADTFSAAYPHESVYVSEKRLRMQAARDEVLAVYRAYGMERAADWKESEDHVASELEFMAVLCERTAEQLDAGDEAAAEELLRAQRNFLDDHLRAWAPMLAHDMRAFAKTKFYVGLAHYLEGFLETDFVLLNDLLAS